MAPGKNIKGSSHPSGSSKSKRTSGTDVEKSLIVYWIVMKNKSSELTRLY